MTKQTKTCIATLDNFFDLADPYSYEFDINEIASSLANLCRYTGHVKTFYSVAEHCVLVSRITPPEFALEGLLHDASEAFCGDVSSPLKAMLPDYRKIEDNVQDAIAKFFNLTYPFPKEVHDADKVLYWSERATVAKAKVGDGLWHQDYEPSKVVKPFGYSPISAKQLFLERYEELTRGRYGSVSRQGTQKAAA